MTKHKIVIGGGKIKFIYADSLRPMMDLGKTTITRVSHVEPTTDGRWTADLNLVCPGLILGPFDTRKEALDAEMAWLDKNMSAL